MTCHNSVFLKKSIHNQINSKFNLRIITLKLTPLISITVITVYDRQPFPDPYSLQVTFLLESLLRFLSNITQWWSIKIKETMVYWMIIRNRLELCTIPQRITKHIAERRSRLAAILVPRIAIVYHREPTLTKVITEYFPLGLCQFKCRISADIY